MGRHGLAASLFVVLANAANATPAWAETATLPPRVHPPDTPLLQAVGYCRDRAYFLHVHEGSLHLNDHRTTACFYGRIDQNLDLAPLLDLAEGGLFVIRSGGGNAHAAIRMAEALHSKNARVVIYDYCLSACAGIILIATGETYVTKNSVVAWHNACNASLVKESTWAKLQKSCGFNTVLSDRFFARRLISSAARGFVLRPQSAYVRKMVRMTYDGSAHHRDLWWTWHPRHYANYLTTKVIYEAYPESQDEVDTIARRLGLPRIIHDP
jgi:hypothetical protein